jgi:hypothetical protein
MSTTTITSTSATILQESGRMVLTILSSNTAAGVLAEKTQQALDAIDSAADTAMFTAGMYPDTATGLINTTDGEYFSIPSPDADEFSILYQNVSGSAVEKKRFGTAAMSQAAINAAAVAEAAADFAFDTVQGVADVAIYNTKAEATAAASGLADQALVMVLADESLAGIKSLYRKESGSLVFKQELLTKAKVDAATAAAEAAQTAAETAADAAQLSAGVYASTAAGIAATTNGQYFSVPSADASEYLILYRNNAGSAVEVKRYPSAGRVAEVHALTFDGGPATFDNKATQGVAFDLPGPPAGYVKVSIGGTDYAVPLFNWYTGGGSAFDPASESPLSWYDPADFTSLFQDTAGTTAVTSAGQPVRRINDKSGNGHHLIMVGAIVPELAFDIARGYYITGAAGWGFASATNYTVGTSHYMILAGEREVENANALFIVGAAATNRTGILNATSARAGATYRTASGTSSIFADGGAVPLNLPFVAECRTTATDIYTASNGGSFDSTGTALVVGDLTSCRVGINITGAASTVTGLTRFYGGITLGGPPSNRVGLVNYMKGLCGLDVIDAVDYDVFVVAGQSNAVGKGDAATATAVTFGTGAEYLDTVAKTSGALKPMADPTRHYGTVLSEGLSQTGSAWPAFCAEYYALTGRRACIVGAALSGNGLTTGGTSWAGDTLLDAAVAKTDRAMAVIIGTGTVRGVLWLGGEADAQANVSKADFKTAFAAFLTRCRTKFGIPTLPIFALSIDRSTEPLDDAKFQAIREAISEACAETDGMYLVMPYQDFVGAALMEDALHWNQTALNTAGATAAQGVVQALGI